MAHLPADAVYVGVSAAEAFLERDPGPVRTVELPGDAVSWAQTFDGLTFPGLAAWDAAVESDGGLTLLRAPAEQPGDSPLLSIRWTAARRHLYDPLGLYTSLRAARAASPLGDPIHDDSLPTLAADEAAVLAARTGIVPTRISPWVPDAAEPALAARLVLMRVVSGRWAHLGLDILETHGWIDEILPELALMKGTEQAKELHPEGNVWQHTLETLRYRKRPELVLGLALIFHDAGKPVAVPRNGRRFDRHAELGSEIAGKALRRLGFDQATVRSVQWLVGRHMMPAALDRLPPHRRDPLMAEPLFPDLLEVYRCDLSSSFRGPEDYYRACRVYRRFAKRAGVPRAVIDAVGA